jgi:hypothetical protein
MNVEHIVADFETCKKAAEIGLNIKSVFTCYGNNYGDRSFALTERPLYQEWLEEYPAPTAEEVPLPRKAFKIDGSLYFILCNRAEVTFDTVKGNGDFIYENCFNPNEATARLKMAIWLIENVPEVRKWYVGSGYLKEVNNERD